MAWVPSLFESVEINSDFAIMRYAILSDIHSNLVALQAVLAHLERRRVDRLICLGDIVGYGPAPNECVQLIIDRAGLCMMGNHDWAVLEEETLADFNAYARHALLWTRKQLTASNKAFLKTLGMMHIEANATFVHSTPHVPAAWDYILSKWEARQQFSFLQTWLCFIGHSHVMGIFEQRQNKISYGKVNILPLVEELRYIINVGAVGQPRDLDPRAAYGIWDSDKEQVELYRVEYDFAQTQRAMQQANLPQYLIDRLADGR